MDIFKPGELVIPKPTTAYKIGLGLNKNIEDLQSSKIQVPQVKCKTLIYCKYGPLIVLESRELSNSYDWAFKVLGVNKAVGWTKMKNPNFFPHEFYYLERLVP